MSNKITPFEFHTEIIRTIDIDGEPMFVAKDIAEILGYASPSVAVSKHCKGVSKMEIPTNGGVQLMVVIPERDVYRLVMNSKMPKAEEFEEWVVGEVLPSIRKTGSYSMASQGKRLPYIETQITLAKAAADMLKMSGTSILRMLDTIGESNGIDTKFLPSYTDEELTLSLTDLLNRHNSTLSAQKANLILLDLGVLREETRKSKVKDKSHKFKVLTEFGLNFGKNETSKQNPRQTNPLYYQNKFPELLRLIEQKQAA